MTKGKQHKRGANVGMRLVLTGFFILLQIAIVLLAAYFFAGRTIWVYSGLEIISIIIVIYILSKKSNPSYKITWIVYILLFPLVGGLVYLFWGGGRVFPHVTRKMKEASEGSEEVLKQNEEVKNHLLYDDRIHFRQSNYLSNASGFPVYDNTVTQYLSPGEKAFPVILEELKKAESYIFLEFFILAEGEMWDEIFAVLKERRANGVEVKVIFDDFGSITRQYRGFVSRLEAAGIQVSVFNKIRPSVDIFMNNRNHRKIIVIDGKVGFTGGINIGDEYINRLPRFGRWMDCCIMLKGKAVDSLTTMFLSMWGFCVKQKQDFKKYVASYSCKSEGRDGYVQPYCDGPVNKNNPAEGIYIQLLNTAQRYVYIATPYLIVDSTMMRELTIAASSGIDVRIITPGHPDKWYVHPVTQSSYDELLAAGVRIYEYTPGFIHSKIFVSDDRVATIGTVNMDYRSFFFHFECGVWVCSSDTVLKTRDHIREIMADCTEIKLEKWRKRPWTTKFKQIILKLFAPFM